MHPCLSSFFFYYLSLSPHIKKKKEKKDCISNSAIVAIHPPPLPPFAAGLLKVPEADKRKQLARVDSASEMCIRVGKNNTGMNIYVSARARARVCVWMCVLVRVRVVVAVAFLLACEDLGRMFDHSFRTCAFFCFFFLSGSAS